MLVARGGGVKRRSPEKNTLYGDCDGFDLAVAAPGRGLRALAKAFGVDAGTARVGARR